MTVAIYGIFDGDHCRYVGQTRNLEQRKGAHRSRFPNCEFRVLRMTNRRWANKHEKETIQRYWSLGQAEHNRAGYETPKLKAISIEESLHRFMSFAAFNEDKKIWQLVTERLKASLEASYGSERELIVKMMSEREERLNASDNVIPLPQQSASRQ